MSAGSSTLSRRGAIIGAAAAGVLAIGVRRLGACDALIWRQDFERPSLILREGEPYGVILRENGDTLLREVS